MATFYYHFVKTTTTTDNSNHQLTSFHFHFNKHDNNIFCVFIISYYQSYHSYYPNTYYSHINYYHSFLKSTRSAHIQIGCHLSLMQVQKQTVTIGMLMKCVMCVSYCCRQVNIIPIVVVVILYSYFNISFSYYNYY